MSYELYEKAKKLGTKAYKANMSEGRYPFLPVLDDIISKEDITGEVSLGIVDIPLSRVVGTSTAARTQSFASNFMPLMERNTEFGSKWSMLSDAHMNEGIRDPIKVYEYMNYYYVVEGNKRVSVLKFFEADSIPAFVTRKVPKLTDDEEIQIYYEFMDFNKKTGINSIWFTQLGSYKRLMDQVAMAEKHGGVLDDTPQSSQQASASDSADGTGILIRTEVGRIWSDDTILELKAAYKRFEKGYKQKGGKKLSNISTGDAFLTFVELKGFDNVCEMSIEEFEIGITSMWQEFLVMNESYEVEVSLDPPEERKTVLSSILSPNYSAAKPLKAAFIYDADTADSDWVYAHELGRNYIKEVFGDKLVTLKIANVHTEDEIISAIEDLVENHKAEVIFTTNAQAISASLKCAIKYPDVKILNCSINTLHRYIRTYDARLYEAKFLAGMIAGAVTETNKIGYMATFPIYGITANINAFALGAKMVNPNVKVYVQWTSVKGAEAKSDLYKSFYQEGIDIVSDQDMITPRKASRKYGMYKLSENGPENMTMTAYNWGTMYERIINIIMQGGWNSADADSESKPINYWWGMSAGVVDIIMSDKIPVGTRRLVNTIKKLIIEDEFSPFMGEIRNQAGTIISEEGEDLEVEEIITMNYLVDNVVGEIPEIDDLKEEARALVEIKGVQQGSTDNNADNSSTEKNADNKLGNTDNTGDSE